MNLPLRKRLRSICIPISIVLISAVIVLLAIICLSTRYSKYNYTFEYAGDEDDPITVTYDLKIRYNSITKKYVIGGKIFLEGYQFQVDGATSDNVTFKVKKITMSPIRGSEYARYVTFYLRQHRTIHG